MPAVFSLFAVFLYWARLASPARWAPRCRPVRARAQCPVSWGQLVALEPEVEALQWRARAAGAGCRNRTDVARAFAPVRNELADLIGFSGKHHRHPVLGSPEAYEVARAKLNDAVAGLVALNDHRRAAVA
jgi:hypothetical protein